MASEYKVREGIERSLIPAKETFFVPGYCFPCRRPTNFMVDFQHCFVDAEGQRTPNWRERMVCRCGLNNRMRASIHVLEENFNPQRNDPIYVTEQITPLFSWLKGKYPQVIGSEFLGDAIPYGSSDSRGVRNESLMRLSFPDASFKFILSFDVFEHVPDFQQGFRECYRCLKSGGILLFSVPFNLWDQKNTVRARFRTTGEIEHVLPPEYHGDPLNSEGCLSFYTFGWELIEIVRSIGFSDACALAFWSRHFGYLGQQQILFVAQKE
jgi:SAM-dependent methyltransferase